jgi:hypothetical protein
MDAFDHTAAPKAIFIPRKSKYEDVTKLCQSIIPTAVQVINLLGLVPRPAPETLSTTLPKLIVCSIADIANGTVNAKDCAHLVWDDYDGTDLLVDHHFTALQDVVYRGPPRLASTTLIPRNCMYRCRLYSFTRQINCFDVQPFSLSREVEGLFASLPAGINVLFTVQPNVFIAKVAIIASLSDLPLDTDHLVIAEVPHTEDGVRAIIQEAHAKIVTFICQPTTPKFLIHQAMRSEGFEGPRSEARTETSPPISVSQARY